jgi:hypothetical protein
MKQIFSILFLTIIGVLMTISFVSAESYTVIQLTDNEFDDTNPRINNNGQVAWQGYDDTDLEIFFYNGSTTSQLTDNNYRDQSPDINNNGQVVWFGFDGIDDEIFFYNGSTTSQLTDDAGIPFYNNDIFPRINNNGQIVWRKFAKILFYDGLNIVQIIDHIGIDSPRLNDAGQIVWAQKDGNDEDIFFFNGSNIIQLTNNDEYDWYPVINNNGEVAWQGYDGSDWEIYLYNGSTVTQLTDNNYDDTSCRLNNSGQVSWQGFDGTDLEIFFYNGATTSQLTNDNYHEFNSQMNDNGQLVWQGYDEIFLYTGSTVIQLTDNNYVDWAPFINDNGQVVWYGKEDGADWEIYLAEPMNPITINISQVHIFSHGTEKVQIQGEIILDEDSDGIDPATEGAILKLSIQGESPFYPVPSNEFMPVILTETPDGWEIDQAEQDRTGIEKLKIYRTQDEKKFLFELVDTQTGIVSLNYHNIELEFSIGNDSGNVVVSLNGKNGNYKY